MDNFTGFQAGVNLGGWISQYAHYDPQHFAQFIQKEDIQRIAGWGMDHVRLPVDYMVLEDDAAPFQYKPSGLETLDRCLEWCGAEGLALIIDLHHAPGFTFTRLEDLSLFENQRLQERFLGLWETLARRYQGTGKDALAFELLNEVVLPSSAPWNALARRAVERIRMVDPARWILIGGNHYNSAWTLKELDLIGDARIAYNFHFYEPMPFTHQKAGWVAALKAFDQTTPYPGRAPGLAAFLEKNPQYAGELGKFVDTPMDQAYLLAMLQPALDFKRETGLPLYCGEYGAIEGAPLASRLAWHRDFCALLRQNGIGRAVWSYKEMDFSLVKADGSLVSQELVEIVSEK